MQQGFSIPSSNHSAFRWHRAVAIAFSSLFAIYAVWAAWINFSDPPGVDFVSFWAAGKLTLAGDPASTYVIEAHRSVEATAGIPPGLMPFPYPPAFLFLVTPFGLLPFWASCLAWIAITAAIYIWACSRIVSPAYPLAHPPALTNAMIGQNGLLTGAIFIGGTTLLAHRPMLGGALLGLLVVKPQLALVLPIVFLAARLWTAAAAAAVTATAICLAALVAFGPASYLGFFAMMPRYAAFLREGDIPLHEMISVFAFCRTLGFSLLLSSIAHVAVALTAAGVTWIAWSRGAPEKIALAAVSTLLLPPYLLTYDGVLLIVPIAWYIGCGRRPALIAAVWLLCLFPILDSAAQWNAPNSIPIASLVMLTALCRDMVRPGLGGGRSRSPASTAASRAAIAPY